MKKISEKSLYSLIKKELSSAGLSFVKNHGCAYSIAGLCDFFIFNKNTVYGLEVKTDLVLNPPTLLQLHIAAKFSKNVIYLFADRHNYQFLLQKIKENQKKFLTNFSFEQIKKFKGLI